MDDLDPTVSNGDLYRVVFENERVRVLEYLDGPGDRTTPHAHPGQRDGDAVVVPSPPARRGRADA